MEHGDILRNSLVCNFVTDKFHLKPLRKQFKRGWLEFVRYLFLF